tara:strand:+ start:569 stop:970 length:402 start_codon:yes stop_codon:yes gene_type:complete
LDNIINKIISLFFFVIEAIHLQVKLKLCTSFLVKEIIALDPLARRQWLYTYKGIIQYADSHGSELTQEQIIGADIYRDLIQQVENLIEEEDYEGQNYNAYKSRDPNYETIYKKRLQQIREDFPIPDQFKEAFI